MTATATSPVKRGFTFTHQSALDPRWKPAEGQKYADGPKAVMIVTRVTKDTVWYGYLGDENPGGFTIDRRSFEARYVDPPLASFPVGVLMTKAFELTHKVHEHEEGARRAMAEETRVAWQAKADEHRAERDAIVREIERRVGETERALVAVEVAERVIRLADESLTDAHAKTDYERVARAREALDMGMERTTTTTCSLVKDQALSDRISKAARDSVRPIRDRIDQITVL